VRVVHVHTQDLVLTCLDGCPGVVSALPDSCAGLCVVSDCESRDI
jgi:hypothetical protein